MRERAGGASGLPFGPIMGEPGDPKRRGGRGSALALALVFASACATPVGVSHLDAESVQRQLTESAVSTGHPSAPTREVLTRLGLRDAFDDDPASTLATLHAGLAPSGDADRLYALAELSFLHAEETGSREWALAAAVYAYAFLFPRPSEPQRELFDPRVQVARVVYNRGLTL